MAEEFSNRYVLRLLDAVQTDDFPVVYHNCGGAVTQMLPQLFAMKRPPTTSATPWTCKRCSNKRLRTRFAWAILIRRGSLPPARRKVSARRYRNN